jgi:hypothetical protein
MQKLHSSMGWEDLHSKINSNNSEDDFFIPGEDVWGRIDSELHDNESNRNWILIFGLFLLFMLSSYLFFSYSNDAAINSLKELQYSNTQIDNHTDNQQGIQTGDEHSSQSSLVNNELINKPELNAETQIKPEIVNEKKDSKVGKGVVFNGVKGISHLEQDNLDVQKTSLDTNTTIDKAFFNAISNDDITLVTLNDYGNELTFSDNWDSNIDSRIGIINRSSNAYGYDVYENEAMGSAQVEYNSQTPINLQEALKTVDLVDGLSTTFNVLSINSTFLDLSNKMLIIENQRRRKKSFGVSILGFASMSDYSINDFSGFGTLEFDLKPNISRGYVIEIEKYLTDRIFISAGFGVDHSHFDADYNFEFSEDELLNSSQQNGQSITSIRKQIPSLAGNLTSVFEVNSFQNIRSNSYSLNLAHDYKTIYVPVSIGYTFLDNAKFSWSMSVRADFSKRLLAIDTGINSIRAVDPLENIELREFSGNETEVNPFRIYNIYLGPGTEFQYNLNSIFNVGFHVNYAVPINDIYSDSNFSIGRQVFRSGIRLTASF